MSLAEGKLKPLTLVRHDGRVWLVSMVNDCRARLQPISGQATISVVSGRPFTTFGNAIDVAPTSYVPVVDEAELTDLETIRYKRVKQEVEMAVAAPPVGEKKTVKQLNDERKARLAAGKAETAAEPKAPRVPKAKTANPCKCGCGGVSGGNFVPGHDAKFKGWLLKIERGQMKVEDLAPSVQTAYKWKKTPDGKGFYPLTNYKGEPYVPQSVNAG